MKIAVTGGTGFVGSHLLRIAPGLGFATQALTRQARKDGADIRWISGALDDTETLDRLVAGADAVIHIAGVINARDRAGFDAGNVAGTANMVAAARKAGIARFIHLSSLSVREPHLSAYGASKHAAEDVVIQSGLDWTIVRPPAVYGPGDRETLEVFRMVARGFAILPGKGRFSLIHVEDLGRALLALTDAPGAIGQTYEIEDGTPGGLSHRDMATLIADALGVSPIYLPLPAAALHMGAAIDSIRARFSGNLPKLSFDRARYLAHPDWTADARRLIALGCWAPRIESAAGIAQTADWYRTAGWL